MSLTMRQPDPPGTAFTWRSRRWGGPVNLVFLGRAHLDLRKSATRLPRRSGCSGLFDQHRLVARSAHNSMGRCRLLGNRLPQRGLQPPSQTDRDLYEVPLRIALTDIDHQVGSQNWEERVKTLMGDGTKWFELISRK